MIINNIFPEKKFEFKTVFTAGVFDGLHLGHQKLLNQMNCIAAEKSLKRVVLSFTGNPKIASAENKNAPHEFKLLQDDIKIKKMEEWADILFLIDFDKNFSELTPEDFIDEILLKKLNVSHIIAGYDFKFGKNKKGGIELLKNKFSDRVIQIPPLEIDGEIVSSSLIRKYINEKNIDKINRLLGRRFSITGVVQHGKRLASTLGFPTVNLAYPSYIADLSGIFESAIIIAGKEYKSISHFGVVPTFNSAERIIETYVFNFNSDIYGERVTVSPLKFLRPIIKFNSIDELKKQIIIDIGKIEK